MTLGEQQRLFCINIAKLIVWAYEQDYELRYDEAYRTPEQAALNAARGTGIVNTLHTKHLAVDLPLFLDSTVEGDEDVYQVNSEAYRPLGEKWKSMHPLNRWGGDFASKDGNHFSMEWQGVK
jgi:hypothetical protein